MGKDREPLNIDAILQSPRPIPRRRLLTLGGLGAAALFIEACGGKKPPTPERITIPTSSPKPVAEVVTFEQPYPLLKVGDKLVDKKLLDNGDRQIKSADFWFDPNYSGGSLWLQICLDGNGKYRVLSREAAPRPGWLVDKSFAFSGNCNIKYPVTELAVGDVEDVYLGVGQAETATYQNMRIYRLKRNTEGLTGEFVSLQTIDPTAIKLRDIPQR